MKKTNGQINLKKMRTIYLFTPILMSIVILFGCSKNSSIEFETVEIYDQTWTSKNLDVDHFADGEKNFSSKKQRRME